MWQGERIIKYQQTYLKMKEFQSVLEERVWQIIEVADQEYYCPALEAINNVIPDSHWDIELQQSTEGLMVFFTRTEAYEDWEENERVHFSWKELEYSEEELLAMWVARGKKLREKEEKDATQQLLVAAEQLGYTLSKK